MPVLLKGARNAMQFLDRMYWRGTIDQGGAVDTEIEPGTECVTIVLKGAARFAFGAEGQPGDGVPWRLRAWQTEPAP